MNARNCDLCGAPIPYTDWNVCESCHPLNAIGNERLWETAKAAVGRVRMGTDMITCGMCGKPIESNVYVRLNDKYVHRECHMAGLKAERDAARASVFEWQDRATKHSQEAVEYARQLDAARAERDEAFIALTNVTGSLVDAGSIDVPAIVQDYGEAVRALIGDRDALQRDFNQELSAHRQTLAERDAARAGHEKTKAEL